MAPPLPTTNTLVAELPHTPPSQSEKPLVWALQVPPPECRMVPALPTANTSVAELPQTASSEARVGLACGLQPPPLLWRMVPAVPTANTLAAELPQMPLPSNPSCCARQAGPVTGAAGFFQLLPHPESSASRPRPASHKGVACDRRANILDALLSADDPARPKRTPPTRKWARGPQSNSGAGHGAGPGAAALVVDGQARREQGPGLVLEEAGPPAELEPEPHRRGGAGGLQPPPGQRDLAPRAGHGLPPPEGAEPRAARGP